MTSAANVTSAMISACLGDLGIVNGSIMMVHSSLKSFGHVDGGADAVVDGLISSVGPDGLAIVPTLTSTFKPGDDAAGSALGSFAFNRKKTPSRVGKITDIFWRRPEAKRSNHPTHSVAAIGKRAEELIEFHGPESFFGRHTPFGKYVNWGGKIVFLGAGLNSNTTLHAVEAWTDMPTLSTEVALLEDDEGNQSEVTVYGAPLGCRDFYRQHSKTEQLLRKHNLIKTGSIGSCEVMIIDAQDMERVLMNAIYTDQPDLLCCDRPECAFCTKARVACFERFAGKKP